jgi:hypothetical protein
MMDLETSRYFDFPSVEVIDLEAPQLPEKEYDAMAVERRSNEPTIMETIASFSKAWQEYERAVLTDKRRIPLRSASVRTPHLLHHGIPKVLVNPRSKGITSVRSTFTL